MSKGAATEIEDRNLLVFLFIKPYAKACCRRLIDDALDIEASNFPGVLGGLTL